MVLLLPALAFVCGSLLVAAVALALKSNAGVSVEDRLAEVTGSSVPNGFEGTGYFDAFVGGLRRLGAAAPRSTAEMGKIQQRLVASGFRRPEALYVFLGIRVGIGLIAFAVLASPVLMRPNVGYALGACGFGYLVPGMLLARRAKARQHRIRLSLPDALDLLVVSVEAGLGLDQAIQRVGEELAYAHPELCEELRLVNLELRAGKARPDALHNLANRTGVDDLSSLVAMLVQTDKFGTSVAQSLRVHSETLRTKRRQRAEEAAAKTGVKMVFPLVFCIFPAIWVVTIGPAAMKFMQVIMPMGQK